MSLPDISFENIRPVDGSRHRGFEEMCCQLASLEPASSVENFYRKGHGGDGGVECYRCRADGTEVGWQAKYLFRWSDSLKTQLDDSIRTALNKHPNLVEYIVCLPFDLPDSRTASCPKTQTNSRLARRAVSIVIAPWRAPDLGRVGGDVGDSGSPYAQGKHRPATGCHAPGRRPGSRCVFRGIVNADSSRR